MSFSRILLGQYFVGRFFKVYLIANQGNPVTSRPQQQPTYSVPNTRSPSPSTRRRTPMPPRMRTTTRRPSSSYSTPSSNTMNFSGSGSYQTSINSNSGSSADEQDNKIEGGVEQGHHSMLLKFILIHDSSLEFLKVISNSIQGGPSPGEPGLG